MIQKVNVMLSILMAATLMSGCASIPIEAPELSIELGKRVSAIEEANMTLLHRFFDHKRKEVDRFIEEEWVPQFAKNFFSNPTIASAWDTVVRENDKTQRLQFIMKTGPRLQAMINQKRVELIQPLDDLERRIEKGLRDEYAQARAMNNSITSFLVSASKVAENRNRYLDMLGVSQSKVGELIDKTDDAVTDLLQGATNAQGKVESGKKFLETIRSIRDSI